MKRDGAIPELREGALLLLASQSPRRRELLSLAGWTFRVAAAEVDETPLPGEAPAAYVLRLAESKVHAVADHASPGWLVVGADTAVVDGDEILGKPADAAEASRILQRLRGRTHQVHSAIAVLRVDDGHLLTDHCVTEVPMRAYSETEVMAYVRSGDPLDKAGAYAIQHPDFRPVAHLDGCYASVMGLPLCHLARTLKRLGFKPPDDVPERCQQALDYECLVFETVLGGVP